MGKREELLKRARKASVNDVQVSQLSTPVEDLSLESNLDNINKVENSENNENCQILATKTSEEDAKIVENNDNVSCETTICTNNDINQTSTNSEEMIDKGNPSPIIEPSPVAVDSKNITQNINTDNLQQNSDDRILVLKEYDANLVSSWGTNINSDVYYNYMFYLTQNPSVKRYNLVNSIIESDMEWVKNHPEFPSKDFVMEQMRKGLKKSRDRDSVSDTFLLTPDSRNYVKQMAKRCGMNMYEYIEYIFELYLA